MSHEEIQTKKKERALMGANLHTWQRFQFLTFSDYRQFAVTQNWSFKVGALNYVPSRRWEGIRTAV